MDVPYANVQNNKSMILCDGIWLFLDNLLVPFCTTLRAGKNIHLIIYIYTSKLWYAFNRCCGSYMTSVNFLNFKCTLVVKVLWCISIDDGARTINGARGLNGARRPSGARGVYVATPLTHPHPPPLPFVQVRIFGCSDL